jgi:hypothetical protein
VEDSTVVLAAIHAMADANPVGPSACYQADCAAQAATAILSFIHTSHQSKSSPGELSRDRSVP